MAYRPTRHGTSPSDARGAAVRLMGALMVGPAMLLLIVFFFIPVALCFALAFTNARLI